MFLHDWHILQLAETPLHQNFLSHLELQLHGDFPSPTGTKDGHPSTKSEFHPTLKHSVITHGEMTTVTGTIYIAVHLYGSPKHAEGNLQQPPLPL